MRSDIPSKAKWTCDAYRRAVAAGEDIGTFVGRLAASEGVNRPAIWRRLRAGGALPPYQSQAKKYPYKPLGQYRAKSETLPPVVDRDPCPRCGTRGDLNCGHSRVRLGTML